MDRSGRLPARTSAADRINSWIKKNRKIRIPWGLNCRASWKRNRTMAEKLRDKPVLGTGLLVNNTGTRGNGIIFIFRGECGGIRQDQDQNRQENPVQHPVRIQAGSTAPRFQDFLMNRSCPSCRTAGLTTRRYPRRTRGWYRHSSPYRRNGHPRNGPGG